MSGGKYANISSSSFLSLKAELSEKKDSLSKTKQTGAAPLHIKGKTAFSSTLKKQKRNKELRSNQGVLLRAAKDQVVYEQDVQNDPDAYKKALERKAKIYDQIRKGKDDLTDAQKEQLLVDWDGKQLHERGSEESSSGSEASSDDDEQEQEQLVEYTDEFGRTRMVPKSQVPKRYSMPAPAKQDVTDNVMYGDQTSFPVYVPDPQTLAKHKAEALAPLETRYDAARENRTKGAGFYSFSQDEESRQAQMRDLERRRQETLAARTRERETRAKVLSDRRQLVNKKREEIEQARLQHKLAPSV